MLKLSFPNYEFRLKKIDEKRFIFDEIRKKYIELTAEEWVRQNCIKFLINEKKYKSQLIAIEKKILIFTKSFIKYTNVNHDNRTPNAFVQ